MNSGVFEAAFERAKEEEGYSAEIYLCPAGKRTIGHGYNLEEGMSREEAALLLRHRLLIAYNELNDALDSYYQARLDLMPNEIQEVLLDVAYNIGVPRLMNFKKMFGALAQNDYERAADELLDSRYAEQVPNRANRNAQKIRSV